MSEVIAFKEVDKMTIPFTKEQLGWILTHIKLTRKGKKLAKQLRRWINE